MGTSEEQDPDPTVIPSHPLAPAQLLRASGKAPSTQTTYRAMGGGMGALHGRMVGYLRAC